MGRPDAVGRVLHRYAVRRGHPQSPRRLQVHIGRGLPGRHLVGRHHRAEQAAYPRQREHRVDHLAGRRAGHGQGPVLGQASQRGRRAGQQGEVGAVAGEQRVDHPAGDLVGLPGHGQLGPHEGGPLLRAHAHHPALAALGPEPPVTPGELLADVLPDALGVDHHAVQVEHDRGGHGRATGYDSRSSIAARTAFLAEAGVVEQLVVGAAGGVAAQADPAHRGGPALGQQLGHGGAEAAVDVVVLDRDHPAGLGRRAHDRVLVEGLDRVAVDELDGHVLGPRLQPAQAVADVGPAGHQRQVAALPQDVGPADLEVRRLVVEHRGRLAVEAQVDRVRVVDRGLEGGHQLVGVGHHHDRERRHGPEHGDVLDGVGRGAVLAVRDAAVRADHVDLEAVVADGLAHVVHGPAQERAEGDGVGHEAGQGEAGGHADHVLLGHAAVEVAVGVGLPELGEAHAAAQVGGHGHEALVALGQGGEGGAEAGPDGDQVALVEADVGGGGHLHHATPAGVAVPPGSHVSSGVGLTGSFRSAMAWRNRSSLMTPWCQW